MEDLQSVVATLKQKFQNNKWFHDVALDRYNRPVVYVYELSREVDETVPQTLGGRQVLVHWASSLTFKKEQFVSNGKENDAEPISLLTKVEDVSNDVEYDIQDDEIQSIGFLMEELDRLEKICGHNILEDMFYEIHDGKNAVTNLSSRFPEVRVVLDKLYNEFGFDVIYEEL